ncbi:RICIN domain-containing protein [Streptomyces sp. NPDC054833]
MGLSTTALASVAVVANSGSAFAASREVTWKNVATARWLEMDTGLLGAGTKVETSERKAGGWDETKNSDGTFTLEWTGYSTGSHCLDSNSDGDVYGISCNGGNNQKWYETKTSTGWRLKNKATGRILDSSASGSVYTRPDNGGKHQRWS